jgi:ubiquinone/menaquinone biosynthesis C-methylase UbiE
MNALSAVPRQESCGPSPTRWESAYQAFETPEEELRKFVGRLRGIGADRWDRGCRVIEICSGRGSGLRAWHALGFRDLVGVDLSPALVAAHNGPGRCVLGDARKLPLTAASRDIAVVQGGLHHLVTHDDVESALSEMCRVVGPSGRIVIVEPWLTPFLRAVHLACTSRGLRRALPKLEALAVMIEEERETYHRWLDAPDKLLGLITRYVAPDILWRRRGKLTVVGRPLV